MPPSSLGECGAGAVEERRRRGEMGVGCLRSRRGQGAPPAAPISDRPVRGPVRSTTAGTCTNERQRAGSALPAAPGAKTKAPSPRKTTKDVARLRADFTPFIIPSFAGEYEGRVLEQLERGDLARRDARRAVEPTEGGRGLRDLAALFPWREVVLPWMVSRLGSATFIVATAPTGRAAAGTGAFRRWDRGGYPLIAPSGSG